MSPQEPLRLAEFVVRPDGTVRGDDGASGELAATLPYAGRLAQRAGELVGVGDLRRIEMRGAVRLSVGVTWTPAGEGTYRAAVEEASARAAATFTVVGGVGAGPAVAHCVDRVAGVDGVAWSAIVSGDARVLGVAGERGSDVDHLPEIGTRVLALLRSLDGHQVGFVRLQFEQGAVVGAMIERHCLIAFDDASDDEALLAVLDEVRAVLDGHDLATLRTDFPPEPAADGPPAADETASPPVRQPAPVGARYRGASGARVATPRRRLFGR